VAAWLVNYAPTPATPGTTIVTPSTPSMGSALQPDLHKYIDTYSRLHDPRRLSSVLGATGSKLGPARSL